MDPDPASIMRVASGYGVSKALLSAVGIGLYTRLADRPMTLGETVAAFHLQERPAMDFLDLLVSVDLLARDDAGPHALYSNTPATARCLVRNWSEYIGGIIEIWEKRNDRFWADITEALHTGKPQNEMKHAGTPFFEAMYADPTAPRSVHGRHERLVDPQLPGTRARVSIRPPGVIYGAFVTASIRRFSGAVSQSRLVWLSSAQIRSMITLASEGLSPKKKY